MSQIQVKVANRGFCYRIEGLSDIRFTFHFIVIGSGGKFQSGEISSTGKKAKNWVSVKIDFPVMHVGITKFDIEALPSSELPLLKKVDPINEPQKSVIPITRRDLLKRAAAASILLAGSMILPAASIAQTPLTSTSYDPYLSNQGQGSFNPYNSSYNPYGNL